MAGSLRKHIIRGMPYWLPIQSSQKFLITKHIIEMTKLFDLKQIGTYTNGIRIELIPEA